MMNRSDKVLEGLHALALMVTFILALSKGETDAVMMIVTTTTTLMMMMVII
jgi:hypothetical protein